MRLSPKDERIRSLEAMLAADGEIITAQRELIAKLRAALEDLYHAYGWLPNVATIRQMQAKRIDALELLRLAALHELPNSLPGQTEDIGNTCE